MNICVQASELSGTLRAPGSKSVMQRAIAVSLLAEGRSLLREPAECEDCQAALRVAGSLGASICVEDSGAVAIEGGFAPRSESLDCGESGLCIRMFTPVAALADRPLSLLGHGSLASRPLSALESPLRQLGADCDTSGGFAPVRVKGPLRGGHCSLDGSAGSQVLTGLLTALPLAPRDSVLEVSRLASKPYIDLTIGVLASFGVVVENDAYETFHIRGGQSYTPRDFEIEADWSGAAFLAVAGLVASGPEGLGILGLDPESAQADRALLDALRMAGADMEVSQGILKVRRSELKGFDFDATDCPDLFPPLAALAALCGSPSRIAGALRLAHKESDRAAAIVEEFARLGIGVEVDGDEMTIRPPARIKGGVVCAQGDHRMAMAAGVLALRAESPVTITGAECVAKSYPGFFSDIGKLGASISEMPA